MGVNVRNKFLVKKQEEQLGGYCHLGEKCGTDQGGGSRGGGSGSHPGYVTKVLTIIFNDCSEAKCDEKQDSRLSLSFFSE